MSGLFRRLSSRRSAGPEAETPPAAADPGATGATAPIEGGHQSLLADPAAQTPVIPEPAPVAPVVIAPLEAAADLPAGLDPDELGEVPPTSARRGKLRRRVAFLRAARELLLRDLGGFIYELHRTAHDLEAPAHRRLRETKLARLGRVDTELHGLELLLDDVRRQVLVREPGVSGECPQCGELFSSYARFCSQCGLPLTESARREVSRPVAPEPEPIVPVPVADQPTEELAASEFSWPSRPVSLEKTREEPPAAEEPAPAEPPAAAEGGAAAPVREAAT